MTHTVDQDVGADKEVFAGEDKTLVWSIKKADESAQDITGWTFLMEVRLTRYTAGLPVFTKAGTILGAPALGQAQVVVLSTETKDLKAGTYYYGLARTNAGAFDVVAEGKFVLRKAAVRVP